MANKNNKKTFLVSKDMINTCIGIMLCLISLLGILDLPLLGYATLYMFGVVGFWGLFPTLFIIGIYVIFSHKLNKVKFPLIIWGFIIILIACCMIFTQFVSEFKLTYDTFFTTFNGNLTTSHIEGTPWYSLNSVSFVLAGGLFGYTLVGLLNSTLTSLGTSIFMWVLLSVGVILVLNRLILKLFAKMRKNLTKSKEERKKDQEMFNSVSKGDMEDDSFLKETKSLPNQVRQEDPIKVEKKPVSDDVPFTSSLARPIYGSRQAPINTSLSKARFSLDDDGEGQRPSQTSYQAPQKEVIKEVRPVVSEPPLKEVSLPKDDNVLSSFIKTPNPTTKAVDNSSGQEATTIKKEAKDNGPIVFVAKPLAPGISKANIESFETKAKVTAPEINAEAPVVSKTPQVVQEPQIELPKSKGKAPKYTFPDGSLLIDYPLSDQASNIETCKQRVTMINQIFNDLSVGAQVISYKIGPSVTRYDVQTNKDTSITALTRYISDLSVRLGGIPVRFEAVVRGMTTSALEIPNATRTTVGFKETLAAIPNNKKSNLFIPFGKNISGDSIYADMGEFPHMLVAGTTGSGKSIFMHGVIMTLIMRNAPSELKLVIVDPKRVEMGKYKDLPHLLCPIITDASKTKVALNKLIDEMEKRYLYFEFSGVSNLRQYNEYAEENNLEKLPYIVILIDEYADINETCKDLGTAVVRLAQKARAAGIHMVISTQRPSVNVITGVIKANLPCRVALSVASAVDSQTVLGLGGAEELLGYGDMLVDCNLISRQGFTRVQGCFVDNKEIKRVVDFIKAQLPADYNPDYLDLEDHSNDAAKATYDTSANGVSMGDQKAQSDEEFYEYLKESVMSREYCSISFIQREFGVGFTRAGKLFSRLQQDGIVSAHPDTASSAKGCKVLIHDSPSSSAVGSGELSTSLPIPPSKNNEE